MKLKKGFMSLEISGQWVVVPLAERMTEFNNIMTLNESGALLWRALEKEVLEQELVQSVVTEYGIDEKTAKIDVREFIKDLLEKDLIEGQ